MRMLVSNVSSLTIPWLVTARIVSLVLQSIWRFLLLRHPQLLCLAVQSLHIQQHRFVPDDKHLLTMDNNLLDTALEITSSIKGGLHFVYLSTVTLHFLLMKHEQHPRSKNDTPRAY